MQVGIIGGGIAGLVAARDLAAAGAAVTVLERAPSLGGLAGSFDIGDGVQVERYYHFICKGDDGYQRMLGELDIAERLRWRTTDMGLFLDGTLHTLGDPFSLLGFPRLGLRDKVRFARTTLTARVRGASSWKDLEDVTAKDWLVATYGERTYTMLYEPLISSKFQDHAEHLSAAWMWARLHRLGNSRSFLLKERIGYLEGGSQAYVDALETDLRARGVELATGAGVDRVVVEAGRVVGLDVGTGTVRPFDAVLSTVPIPHTGKLFADLHGSYFDNLRSLEYLGVMVVLLRLDRPLSKYYWMNVSDSRCPMSGIIQATNLNPLPQLGGDQLVYIPQYIDHRDPTFAVDDDELVDRYCDALALVNPAFDRSWVRRSWVHRERYAQPVCDVGFTRHVPSIETPVPGLFLTDSYQLHPHDRAISFSTDLGREAARLVLAGATAAAPATAAGASTG